MRRLEEEIRVRQKRIGEIRGVLSLDDLRAMTAREIADLPADVVERALAAADLTPMGRPTAAA